MRAPARVFTILVFSVLAFMAVAIGAFFWRAQSDRRSLPGHIVRRLKGEGGALQDLNDLSEDIRNKPSLSQLQPWAMETLKRFREGQVQTNGYSQLYWDASSAIRLARQERPQFIKQQWGETNEYGEEEPEIDIVLGSNKQPEAVAIGWYSYGIQIGPVDYQMPYKSSDISLYVKAKPGIFVYANYK